MFYPRLIGFITEYLLIKYCIAFNVDQATRYITPPPPINDRFIKELI